MIDLDKLLKSLNTATRIVNDFEHDRVKMENEEMAKKLVAYVDRELTKPNTGDYLVDMVWWTEDLDDIPLGKMTRSHVRNSLQWCMRKNIPSATKDGYTYQQWMTAFTVRLLDPTLP